MRRMCFQCAYVYGEMYSTEYILTIEERLPFSRLAPMPRAAPWGNTVEKLECACELASCLCHLRSGPEPVVPRVA